MKQCPIKEMPEREDEVRSALDISALNVVFPTKVGDVHVARDVYLRVGENESLCLAGESGCGKSVLALAITRLLPKKANIQGKIRVHGVDILEAREECVRRIRCRQISLIQEQPSLCLNPVMNIGSQVAEAARVSLGYSSAQAKRAALDLLRRTGIPEPKHRYRLYPHQLSGGMNQRVMIAMALAARPRLLIADEPTTALDPYIQVQLIELLQGVKRELGASLLLITHDLDVALELCTDVAIMYAGQVMERGKLERVVENPRHPYTQGLLRCFSEEKPRAIPGVSPPLSDIPSGCGFHPRCPLARPECATMSPIWRNGCRCHL
jgi:oligopeptide/dipeptide ABC transporter ATP-binding protein